MRQRLALVLLLFLSLSSFLSAQVTLPQVLSDNMVLQQGKKVAIWGTASPYETITVKFEKQTKKATADDTGNWSVKLDELKMNRKPQKLTVSGKKNKIVLNNILIGEVWLASGQSNMEYSMNKHPRYAKPKKGDPEYLKKEFDAADNPEIRILYVDKNLKTDTLPSIGWQMLNAESLAPVSAIGYFFAKDLVETLDVPIGIISTSWGGTLIETWTAEEAYRQDPVFAGDIKNHRLDDVVVGERYEKMVKPMIPYTLRGFLWYQGESNLTLGDRMRYADKQRVLIESWRSVWDDDSLSFYYVQLAPHTYSKRKRDRVVNNWQALPYFWAVQTSCLAIPNTGMVVTTDLVDNTGDIHPPYKWIVGERLARLALAKNYGKTDLVYSGPTYQKMTVDGDRIIVEFDHIGSGLITRDGKSPTWFEIRNASGRFQPAEAVIEGNKIILSNTSIKNPAAVRLAWDEEAMPNLCNKEGLPAVPFCTDLVFPLDARGGE